MFLYSQRQTICSTTTGYDASRRQSVAAPEIHLNEIYLTVLETFISQYYTEREKEDLSNTLREILGSFVILASSLSAFPRYPWEDQYSVSKSTPTYRSAEDFQKHYSRTSI